MQGVTLVHVHVHSEHRRAVSHVLQGVACISKSPTNLSVLSPAAKKRSVMCFRRATTLLKVVPGSTLTLPECAHSVWRSASKVATCVGPPRLSSMCVRSAWAFFAVAWRGLGFGPGGLSSWLGLGFQGVQRVGILRPCGLASISPMAPSCSAAARGSILNPWRNASASSAYWMEPLPSASSSCSRVHEGTCT
mgnify:CR=1 FL=1